MSMVRNSVQQLSNDDPNHAASKKHLYKTADWQTQKLLGASPMLNLELRY